MMACLSLGGLIFGITTGVVIGSIIVYAIDYLSEKK